MTTETAHKPDLRTIEVRVTQGETKSLLIESNCQLCGKPTACDMGSVELLKDFDVEFWCARCDHEWGVQGRFVMNTR